MTFIGEEEKEKNEVTSIKEPPSPWTYLPVELVDIILSYLTDSPDTFGSLLIATKVAFQPTERLFRALCEYIYTKQTGRAFFKLEAWKSWKNMIINRPRLRTNGFYSLKTLFTKVYNNDAFWEERKYESIEVRKAFIMSVHPTVVLIRIS
jgi:hypothetical protein